MFGTGLATTTAKTALDGLLSTMVSNVFDSLSFAMGYLWVVALILLIIGAIFALIRSRRHH